MKSSVSPTTSAVANAPAAVGAASDDGATAAFEALLVPALLKPVIDSLGPLGATFGDTVARALIDSSSEEPAL